MQEDAADIFIRARDDLVNAVSVLDEDISTYVEEYIFAKANLDANGFDLNPTWKEEVCDLLIKEKRRKRKLSKDEMPLYRKDQSGHNSVYDPFKNRIESRIEEHTEEHIPHTAARGHGAQLNVKRDPTSYYPSAHPFDRDHNPLHRIVHSFIESPDEKKSGIAMRFHILAKKFLPAKEGEKTIAEKLKNYEIALENYLTKTGNHALSKNVKGGYSFLGPLDVGKGPNTLSHDVDAYNRDFERWKKNNDDGSSDFELRKNHFEDRLKSWENRKHNPEYEEGSDPKLAEFYQMGVGNLENPKDMAHPEYLSDLSHFLGLEWFSPKERTKIFDHFRKYGSDSNRQLLKFDDGFELPMGRLKRTIRTRTSNAKTFTSNEPHLGGDNNITPISMSNLPETDKDKFAFDSAFRAARVPVDKDGKIIGDITYDKESEDQILKPLSEIALENLHDSMGHDIDEDGWLFQAFPNMSKKRLLKLKRESGDDFKKALAKESKNAKNMIPERNLLHALGFHSDGNEMEEHEVYDNFSGPLIDNKMLKELMRKKKDFLGLDSKHNQLDDAYNAYESNKISNELLKVPEIRKAFDDLGGTPASIFAPAYRGAALGMDFHTLFRSLHYPIADKEGNSILGSTRGDHITPNQNQGMFAHLFFPRPEESKISSHALQHNKSLIKKVGGFDNIINAAKNHSTAPHVASVLHGNHRNTNQEKYKQRKFVEDLSPFLFSTNPNSDNPYGLERSMSINPVVDDDVATDISDTLQNSFKEIFMKDKKADRNALFYAKKIILRKGPEYFDSKINDEINAKLFGGSYHGDRFDAKAYGDIRIISEMAKHLTQYYPDGFLDPSNPAIRENVARLFADANMALKVLPPKYYEELGIPHPTTIDWGFSKEEVPLDPKLHSLGSFIKQAGIPVHSETDVKEVAEQLGFPLDKEHLDHIRKTLGTIPEGEGRFLMSQKQMLSSLLDDDYDRDLDEHLHEEVGGDRSRSLNEEKVLLSRKQANDPESRRKRDLLGPLVTKEKDLESTFRLLNNIDERHSRNPELTKKSLSRILSKFGIDHDAADFENMKNNLEEHYEEERHNLHSEASKILEKESFGIENGLLDNSNKISKLLSLKEHAAALGMTYFEPDYIEQNLKTKSKETGGEETYRPAKNTPFISTHGKKRATTKNLHPFSKGIHAFRGLVLHDGSDTPLDTKVSTEKIDWFNQPVSHDGSGPTVTNLFGECFKTGLEMKPEGALSFEGDKPTFYPTNHKQRLTEPAPQHLNVAFGNEMSGQIQNAETRPLESEQSHATKTPEGLGDVQPMISDPLNQFGKDAGIYANLLLNPDELLIKGDKEPGWVPPIRPMHRIFKFKQLEELRGFTGGWCVSKWYDGKRLVITKKNKRVTAYYEDGSRGAVPDWVKTGIKKLGEKDATFDAILSKKNLHVIDIMHYDGTDIMDMTVRERFKVLRGQFDSHEEVIICGPHDTRFTDDEGLKDAVDSLSKEHSTLLLRDNKSTYMRGEKRHPKWVLLRKNRDLNLIVLDRRGEAPEFIYRLGAGPVIDKEGFGDRAVPFKDQVYVDVATITSPKPFEEGEIVRARFTGVEKNENYERDVYNVQLSKLVGEGEGEGSASLETLSLLAKSFPPIHLPHDIDIVDNNLIISLPNDDSVIYKLEKSSLGYWVHSPTTTLSDMGLGEYSVELSESLKPFWGQVASLMLKGKVTKLPAEDKKVIEDIQEEESAGLVDADDKNRLLKPNFEKALEIIERSLDVLDKGHSNMAGRGLGIDLGEPNGSPRGPTVLQDESTMPDYDMRSRPTEEPEKPEDYPKAKRDTKKKLKSASYK